MNTQRKSGVRSRAEQAHARREEILATALRLFAHDGVAGTSTRRIADAAGINESLVFHYFPTKAALLLALATRRHTFAGRLLDAIDTGGDRPLPVVVREIARGLPTVLREEGEIIGLLLAESFTNPELYGSMTATMDRVVAGFAAYLAARVTAGEVARSTPLEAAARGFLGGFVFFFITRRRLGPAAWVKEARRFADDWTQTWLSGVEVPTARRSSSGSSTKR